MHDITTLDQSKKRKRKPMTMKGMGEHVIDTRRLEQSIPIRIGLFMKGIGYALCVVQQMI